MSEQDFLQEVLLEANIREFSHTISLICALEAGGKLTAGEAFILIKRTWSELKVSRKHLYEEKTSSEEPGE